MGMAGLLQNSQANLGQRFRLDLFMGKTDPYPAM